MYVPPRNDLAYSQYRLSMLLSRRRLLFNPYTVGDRRLLDGIAGMGWGSEFDLTDMVILHFTNLRRVSGPREFSGIYMTVGASAEEVFVPVSLFRFGITANDTLRRERVMLGKVKLSTYGQIENLVGKTVFVSRRIRGMNIRNQYKVAYRMHQLRGNIEKDAVVIREAICAAKIEMLGRVLQYPQSPDYLSCRKGFFDYETPIRQLMETIRTYPQSPVPPG